MRHTNKRTAAIAACLLLFVVTSLQVFALGLGTFESQFTYTPDQLSSIKYVLVNDNNENLTVSLDYTGSLAPYAKFRMDNYWYSTRVEKLDVRLQREFDLSNITSATLTFYTKYTIEYGWDFGYVEVSTNNGSTWNQIAGTGTTTYRDGAAYVGVNGAPAYTGTVSNWTLETMNLTPYVGNLILLRFRYVTDDYYSEYGWLVDDISIPEIGFYDNVDSVTTSWATNNWLHNVMQLDRNDRTHTVYIDFTIPSSFSYNNTEEIVTVSQIAGVEQGYNSAHGAVSTIIARMPPVVKAGPQPVAPGGGGSSGGGFYSHSDGYVNFVITEIQPDTERVVLTENLQNIIKSITLTANTYIRKATVLVIPLDSKPDSIKQNIKDSYSFFDVSTFKLDESVIDSAVFRIIVKKDWLEQKQALTGDIVVTRFNSGKWEDLDTWLVYSDSKNHYFDAKTPGFSVFAVRLRGPIEPLPVIEPVPTEKPNISDVPPLMIVAGNESLEKVVSEAKDILLRKSNLSAEPAHAVPEAPAPPQPDISRMFTGFFVLIAALAALMMFLFNVMAKRHAKERTTRSKKK
jgi:PGF-pre-PGF domain-containing protein